MNIFIIFIFIEWIIEKAITYLSFNHASCVKNMMDSIKTTNIKTDQYQDFLNSSKRKQNIFLQKKLGGYITLSIFIWLGIFGFIESTSFYLSSFLKGNMILEGMIFLSTSLCAYIGSTKVLTYVMSKSKNIIITKKNIIDKFKLLSVFFIFISLPLTIIDFFPQMWWWIFIVPLAICLIGYFFLWGFIHKKIHKYQDFDKFHEVRMSLEKISKKINFSIKEIYTIPTSCKDCTPRKFFFSGTSKRRIAVFYDDLLEKMNPEQIGAIFAREVFLHRRGHEKLGAILACVTLGFIFWVVSFLLVAMPEIILDLGFSETKPHAVLLLVYLTYQVISPLITYFVLYPYFRKFQYAADRYGCQATSKEHIKKGIMLLNKPTGDDLLSHHPLYIFVKYKKPLLLNRVKALDRL